MKQKVKLIFKGIGLSGNIKLLIYIQLILFLCVGALTPANGQSTGESHILRVNPEYKIKRLSTGTVIATKNLANGEVVEHKFDELYADVLLAAYRRQSVRQILPVITKKYYFDKDECRREIKHVINVLTDWDILLNEGNSQGDSLSKQ